MLGISLDLLLLYLLDDLLFLMFFLPLDSEPKTCNSGPIPTNGMVASFLFILWENSFLSHSPSIPGCTIWRTGFIEFLMVISSESPINFGILRDSNIGKLLIQNTSLCLSPEAQGLCTGGGCTPSSAARSRRLTQCSTRSRRRGRTLPRCTLPRRRSVSGASSSLQPSGEAGDSVNREYKSRFLNLLIIHIHQSSHFVTATAWLTWASPWSGAGGGSQTSARSPGQGPGWSGQSAQVTRQSYCFRIVRETFQMECSSICSES